HDEVQACAGLLAGTLPTSLPEWTNLIEVLNEHAAVIDDIVAALSHEHGQAGFAEIRWWTSSLLHQARAYRRDLHLLAPWSTLNSSSSILTGASDLPAAWAKIAENLHGIPTLAHVSEICDTVLFELA